MAQVFSEVLRQCNKMNMDVSELWEFRLLDNSLPVGYMTEEHIRALDWTDTDFSIDEGAHAVRLNPTISESERLVDVCLANFVRLCQNNKSAFRGSLGRWVETKSDYHGIRWLDAHLHGMKIPTPLRGVFGIVTAGVHLNVYTSFDLGKGDSNWLWVSRRSQTVTFPGCFDQIVAGAMEVEDGDDPLVTLKREAWEEANLVFKIDTKTMFQDGVEVGKVTGPHRISFYDLKDAASGSEEGHLEPGVRFVFDLHVCQDFKPVPSIKGDIESFSLKSVIEVETDLVMEGWKPSSRLATLDFLVRNGFETTRIPVSVDKIEKSLQRVLPLRCM